MKIKPESEKNEKNIIAGPSGAAVVGNRWRDRPNRPRIRRIGTGSETGQSSPDHNVRLPKTQDPVSFRFFLSVLSGLFGVFHFSAWGSFFSRHRPSLKT